MSLEKKKKNLRAKLIFFSYQHHNYDRPDLSEVGNCALAKRSMPTESKLHKKQSICFYMKRNPTKKHLKQQLYHQKVQILTKPNIFM